MQRSETRCYGSDGTMSSWPASLWALLLSPLLSSPFLLPSLLFFPFFLFVLGRTNVLLSTYFSLLCFSSHTQA